MPKIPFKLTQSIHAALQKNAILTENCWNYLFFNTKTNKGEIGLYFENDEKKLLGGATSQKSQKEMWKPFIIIPSPGMALVSKEAVWST